MSTAPPTQLGDKINSAPTQPGCYLYFDKYGNVIYVGKAKNLRSRVKQYFTKAAAADERLTELLPRIADVAYEVTPSELDALLLEYRLIKQYKPWHNSQMKADKPRPFLRIAREAPYPVLHIVKERADDGATYCDCFTDEGDVRAALALLGQVWRTAQCGKAHFHKPASPCLYHSLHGCMAPCAHKADPAAYSAAVDEIEALLAGHRVPRLTALKQQMEAFAEGFAFEEAATRKRQWEGLRRLQRKGKKMYHYPPGAPVMVLIRPFRETAFSVFYVREGAVVHRQNYTRPPNTAATQALLHQWQAAAAPTGDGALLARCLTEISAHKVFVQLPPRPTAKWLVREIQKFTASK